MGWPVCRNNDQKGQGMARFTMDPAEIQRLQDVEQEVIKIAGQNGGRLKLVLARGVTITGRLSGFGGGNNGGRGGFWCYCGEVTIVDDNGNANTIDKLMIDRVESP
jgi:hypothetical protein